MKIKTAIKITLSLLIIWFLIHTAKLDLSQLGQLFTSPMLFITALPIFLMAVFIGAWRWYQLNKAQQIPLSFSQTILPSYLGAVFNAILPGGVGGDVFRGFLLFKNIPDKRSAIILSILVDRLCGLVGIITAISLVVFTHFNSLHSPYFKLAAFCMLSLMSMGIVIFYVLYKLVTSKTTFSNQLQQRFANKPWSNTLLSFLTAINVYSQSKWVVTKCLIASLLMQFVLASICYIIATLMHFPSLPFYSYLIAVGITQMVNLIPVTPGGFGIGEAAFANVLMLLNPGISASYATIFLAYRLLNMTTYLPGLGIFVFNRRLLRPQAE